MAQTDRGKYVTEQVALWAVNDGEVYERAKRFAYEPRLLAAYLSVFLRLAKRGTTAWHVRMELAPNDFDRIDWAEVAEQFKGE